jgi:aspartyl-tRNA(Asn)/glutamyl-tRNA(Gln) amidotransferase subunit A
MNMRTPGTPNSGSELAWLSATELVERYRRRELSPVEVVRMVVDRAERSQRQLNAFCLLDPEAALAAARESEARWRRNEPLGLLDGVPVSIKDIVITQGWPTLRGSRTIPREQPWLEDAPSVARLREHGAVLFGKTTTPEFAVGAVTDSPLTGVTRNPWNLSTTPGGSSGGAAAAVAAGIGPLAVATDAAGSIRVPASFTGNFGFKPSVGRVPAYPPTPYGTLASTGPISRTVADAARMLTVVSESDPRDAAALPPDAVAYHQRLERNFSRLRIAYSPTLGFARVDPAVAQLVEQAAAAFSELGAQVELVEKPFENPLPLIAAHRRCLTAFAFESFGEDKLALMDEQVVEIIRESRSATLSEYLRADSQRMAFIVEMNHFHLDYSLLLTPAVAVPPFSARLRHPEGYPGANDWYPFTVPFNFSRQPAASVPCGFTREGLPVGLQIVGPAWDDLLVLQAARAFEQARPWAHARPPMAPP